MVIQSWESNEALEYLTEVKRNGEIIEGVVRSSRKMKLPLGQENGEIQTTVEQDTLIVHLPGDVTGYCPASEFREREHRSHVQFISQRESFVVTKLDLDNKVAILSANKAAQIQSKAFWDTIEASQAQGGLEETIYEGVVTGYKNSIIYVRVAGQDCYMFRNEWSWRKRDLIDAMPGETIQVKVLLFDKEKNIVRVSRKQTIPNPWEVVAKEFKIQDLIAGKVVEIHPVHGIFVQIAEGVELKGSKLGSLVKPDIGDFVSCRLTQFDPSEEKGRVVILSYPRGKRKKKDLGSFLFQ